MFGEFSPKLRGSATASNMTAYNATRSTTQSIPATTYTKLQINTQVLDAGGYYDNATNYRYTPLIPGKYIIVGTILWDTSTTSVRRIDIYKNGNSVAGTAWYPTGYAGYTSSVVVQMDGISDYIEIYGYQSGAGSLNILSAAVTGGRLE